VRTVVAGRRTPAEAERHYDSFIHYCRWDAVVDDRYGELRADDRPRSLERAFDRATEMLAGSEAAADRDTIKRSYYRVQNDIEAGKAGKYYFGASEPRRPPQLRRPRKRKAPQPT
jgi:hypothetical protein